MRQAAKISPVNSLVFIHGGRGDVSPLPIWGAQISATNSCVSVVCYPEIDGPTELVLGDVAEVGLERPADFETILRTPDLTVIIQTVDDQTVMTLPTAAKLTALKIWRSHPLWPEIVTVGIETPRNMDSAKRAMLPTEQTTRTSSALCSDVSSIFLCDGGFPRTQRDFNPWSFPEFLRSGISLAVRNPVALTLTTGRLTHLFRPPDLDAVLATPNKEVWIFPDHQKVLLKVDCEQTRTRLRAWIERSAATENLTISLG